MTTKCIKVNHNKNIRSKTSILRSKLCDCNNVYIIVKERISVRGTNDANRINKKLAFKNNAPFRSYISKIKNTFVENVEGIDIVVSMYNL